jgi:hypothetical protein
MSTAYHPQTDGCVERSNQVIEKMLRCTSSSVGADWVQKLPSILLSMNTNVSKSTGFSPAHLLFGFSPRTVWDIEFPDASPDEPQSVTERFAKMRADLQEAHQNLTAAKQNQKVYADRHRTISPRYSPGDLVLLNTRNLRLAGPRKFWPRWIGPFEVLHSVGSLSFKLKLPEAYSRLHPVFHTSLLKLYHAADDTVAHVIPPLQEDDYEVHEVQAILNHKFVGKPRRLMFQIYWKGFPLEEATWSSPEDLTGCEELLQAYIVLHRLQKYVYW